LDSCKSIDRKLEVNLLIDAPKEKYKQGLPYKIGAIGNIMHAQAQKTP